MPRGTRHRNLSIALSAALLVFFGFAPHLSAQSCTAAIRHVLDDVALSSQVPKRSLEELPELRMGTFNTYNLMQSADGAYQKGHNKRLGIAAPILENDLDIVVLQEVENLRSLEDFVAQYLHRRYDVLLSQGNDSRGIQVAYLVKRDLPFRITFDSHADTRAVYTVTGEETKIFSRDVPSLRIWAHSQNADNDDPLIVIYGTHFKSKRSKPGDPESRVLRRTQVEASVEIIRRDKNAHPSSLMMIAGDFNGDVRVEAEFAPLREILRDAFDTLAEALSDADRVTHTFHPQNGPTSYSQIDAFFVSPEKSDYVSGAFVHRYKDEAGNIKPLPSSWHERNTNPSDHFPVILKLNFRRLLEERGIPRTSSELPTAA
jgi:endonuclease/exonuclease/phosphatase family metal-dependent hydrolase